MNRLIRLYPRAWRERYGEELSALLEDRPPGPSDALDLLLGAFDAHLHRRHVARGTRRRQPRMSIRSVHPMLLVYMVLGALAAGYALMGGIAYLADPDPAGWDGWGPVVFTAAPATILAGLAVSLRWPAVGALLGIAGAMLAVATAPWTWVLAIPVGLTAAIPFLVRRRGRRRSPQPVSRVG